MDKTLYRNALISKFKDQAISTIVTTAFTQALPFNAEALESERAALDDIAMSTLAKIGPSTLLSKAMENTTKPMWRGFLKNIDHICTDIATEAADHAIAETPSDISFTDAVDKAAFTDAEIKKLSEKAEDLTAADVAPMINGKVIDCIKAEKEAYEANKELQDELNNALVETKDYAAVATTEALCDLLLPKSSPRQYISLFSKMLDTAMEGIGAYTAEYGEMPYPVVESMLDLVLNIKEPDEQSAAQGAITARNQFSFACEGEGPHHDCEKLEKISKIAMVCTITCYTLLETLKCMHMLPIGRPELQKFVDHPVRGADMLKMSDDSVADTVNNQLGKLKSDIGKAASYAALEDKRNCLESWKNCLDTLPADSSIRIKTEPTVIAVESFLTDRSNALSDTGTSFEGSLESFQYYRNRETTVAAMTRMNNSYERNPKVSEIRILVTNAMESSSVLDNPVINVKAIGENGATVDSNFFDYRHCSSAGTVVDCLRSIMMESRLGTSNKRVTLYNLDKCRPI